MFDYDDLQRTKEKKKKPTPKKEELKVEKIPKSTSCGKKRAKSSENDYVI